MKTTLFALATLGVMGLSSFTQAAQIDGVPNTMPDGMYMPMIGIAYSETEPDKGAVIVIPETRTPVLQSLQEWSPGAWFDENAPWRGDLGSIAGEGGTPLANAGSGALFSNQYGFMKMMMSDALPLSQSLAIRLVSASSGLQAFNYMAGDGEGDPGLWDQIWVNPGDQVVWSEAMWHNYFVMPAGTAPGVYTMEFEIFVVDYQFQAGTGAADYSPEAMAALRDPNMTSAYLTYHFEVIPEPSTWLLLGGTGAVMLVALRRRRA